MAAIGLSVSSPYIRKVNVRRDLLAIADLIEVCFANTLDDDGREYLRQMRWAARDLNYLSWIQGAAERIAMPLYGFVWEENNRIVGNLSLIPLNRKGRLVYLIANVAVLPEYRRRGIGQQLTQTAIEHLRERGIEDAWLQVRDDNPGAHHLYLSLGFTERARRTTWQSSSFPPINRTLPTDVEIRRRRSHDWETQVAWLREAYPADVAWNMPLNIPRLSPDLVGQLLRWLRGESQEHWAAWRGQRPIGFASWEPMRSASDNIWLAAPPDEEDAAILALLSHARLVLSSRERPLAVNYPAGRGDAAFQRAGFINHQTLIWMSVPLNPSNNS